MNSPETDLEAFAIDKIPEETPSALIENLNAKSQSSKLVWHTVFISGKVHE